MKWKTRVIKFETARTEIKKSQPFRVGVAILLGMLHAKETGISSGNLCLWLMYAFTFFHLEKVTSILYEIYRRSQPKCGTKSACEMDCKHRIVFRGILECNTDLKSHSTITDWTLGRNWTSSRSRWVRRIKRSSKENCQGRRELFTMDRFWIMCGLLWKEYTNKNTLLYARKDLPWKDSRDKDLHTDAMPR